MPTIDQIQVGNIIYDIRDATANQRTIPSGGTAGQILTKSTTTDYDASWQNLPSTFPPSAHNHDDRYYTTTSIDSLLSTKAPLASPAFTGTPTAPTATDGTNNTQIATTQFVHNAFKANDAMVFKGTIGSSGATVSSLPATHYQGWTYKVITTGTYAGQNCEIGDMIICVTDGTSASDAHWTVVQSNVDGAVIGPSSATDAHVATFNGTSGKVIKDSGFTIGKSVPSNAVFTDTIYTNGNGVILSGTTFSADFPSSGTPAALGTASNGSANTVARSDHVHAKPSYGNINTSGAITSTTTIANGDKIVIVDSSDSSKLTGTSITFDGSTVTKALTQKGTWETFASLNHTHNPEDINDGYLEKMIYLNTHPENNGVMIPFVNNDIAFLTKIGGSFSSYITTATDYTPDTINNSGSATFVDVIANMFDASPSYCGVRVEDVSEKIVIEITLPSVFGHTCVFYIDFGANGWRAKDIYYLARNSNSESTWTEVGSITNNTVGHWIKKNNFGSTGLNQIRLVLTNWNTLTPRIAQIGLVSYNSRSLNTTFMSRGSDGDVYRSITPNVTGTYSLGTSTKKWANTYVNNLYSDKINGITVPTSPKFTDTTYTATTTSIGSASAGTAIKADDITAWSTGTLPTLGTAIPVDDITAWSTGTLPTLGTAIKAHNISSWSTGTLPTLGTAIPVDDITAWSTGTLPTLGTAISADDITAWSAGTLPSATVQNENLIISFGSLPSLSYTTRSIPNVTDVGTLPSLSYDSKSIPNVTGVGTLPSLSYSEKTIPNITAVGTLPNLSYDSKSIPNVTSVGTLPSLSYTEKTIPNISITNKNVVTEILDS